MLPNPSVARRLSVYSDSIGNGALADLTARHGWIGLLRATYSGRISVEGWGGKTLYEDSTVIAATAARLVGLCFSATTKEVWDECGYNDYSNGDWTSAAYGTAVAALYDAIHAADPSVRIYCQTQLITSTEAATNSKGEAITAYRAAKAAAAVGRSWVTVVDGTTLMAAGQLSGVHPNTAGHAAIAAAIAAILG